MWNAVYNRKKTIAKTAGAFGVVYFVSKCLAQRLDDMRQAVVQERAARESLRRRYDQTQEDILYTVMALLPALADKIQIEMDVENIMAELQALSKPKSRVTSPNMAPPPELTASTSEFLLPRHPDQNNDDSRSEADTESVASSSASHYDRNTASPSLMGESTSSWVDRFSSTASLVSSPGGATTNLSDSITSAGSIAPSALSESQLSTNPSRTKAELWKELKFLSISRALTTAYAITLLTSLTSVQLTQLARRRYVAAVRALEREERNSSSFDLTSILLGGLTNFSFEDFPDDNDSAWEGVEVDQPTEHMFLTLSWWILHIGWKDLSELISSAVKDVFLGVSLKTRLTAADIVRLFNDVRRNVEWEGGKRRHFTRYLIPTTPDTTQEVLVKGGVLPSNMADSVDAEIHGLLSYTEQTSLEQSVAPCLTAPLPPVFESLHSEALLVLSSPEFDRVLESSLDAAVNLLSEETSDLFSDDRESDNRAPELRLAEILPGLSRWSQGTLNALPNRLVDRLLSLPETGSLSAIIFSRFQDNSS